MSFWGKDIRHGRMKREGRRSPRRGEQRIEMGKGKVKGKKVEGKRYRKSRVRNALD